MEKILKIILIPFLFVILTIKSAYAETNKLYIYNNNASYTLYNSVSDENTYTKIDDINFYNNKLSIYVKNSGYKHKNFFVFYDTELEKYLLLDYSLVNTVSDDSSSNNSLNIHSLGGGSSFRWYYYNNSNNQIFSSNFSSGYGGKVRVFPIILDDENSTTFAYNYFPSYSTITYSFNYNSFYIYGTRGTSFLESNFYNNISSEKIKLVYVESDNFYKGFVALPLYTIPGSEPDEPEEPEEPEIPIFNANLNKFYVPDYQEGQCVEVLDKDTIRVFNDSTTSFYTDYFINSNYISRTGQVDIDYEKNCSTLDFTSDYKYRNDLSKICFITLCIIGFTILPCYVLWKVFYKRG